MNKADHYPITRSLAYLALTVPDLPAAIQEAQEINGLHLVGCSADAACLTSGERKFELLLRSGGRRRCATNRTGSIERRLVALGDQSVSELAIDGCWKVYTLADRPSVFF